VHRLMDAMHLCSGVWYEPCAGHGAIVKAVSSWHKKRRFQEANIRWVTNDIDPSGIDERMEANPLGRNIVSDYLIQEPGDPVFGSVNSVITNPPYILAFEVIKKTFDCFHDANIVMLLRICFLASIKRQSFLCRHVPDIYVLPNRPSFTYDGQGQYDYAWFVWKKDQKNKRSGRISILDTTPIQDRKNNK